ncbi:MAG: hypothetical protein AB7F64_01900 [Gammaproteobacteria bacterium]
MLNNRYKNWVIILIACIFPLISFGLDSVNYSILPLKFDTGNPSPYGLPSTIITIQGKQLPLIFDTGASKSDIILSKYALNGLHVKFTGKSLCYKSFDGSHCEKEFIVPKLKIGNFIIRNVKGTLMTKLWGGNDAGFKDSEASRNGVIGYGLISKFNVLLDYSHSQAIFIKKGIRLKQYYIANWINVPFHKHLLTDLSLNKNRITLGWDTGAIPSIIKETSVKRLEKSTCTSEETYKDKNSLCIVTKNLFAVLTKQQMPNTWFLLENIPDGVPFDGLIGSNFFRENLVYFDFEDQNIYVKNNSKI